MFAAECFEKIEPLDIPSNDGNFYFSISGNEKNRAAHLSGNIRWRFHGNQNLPVVVVLGGISANRNVVSSWCIGRSKSNQNKIAGWWDDLIGHEKAINTSDYSVLSFDFIGGNGDSYLEQPLTPELHISTFDQARVLKKLLDHLQVKKLKAIVASSYGGMVSLAFSELFGDRLEQQIVISAAAQSHPRSTALRSIQRQVVKMGLSLGDVKQGLALARQLGMVTYRSIDEFSERFTQEESEKRQGAQLKVENYLKFHGNKFSKVFCPHAFLCLSESIDRHHINPAKIKTPSTLISVNSDELVFTSQVTELGKYIQAETTHITLDSLFGHDAFLKEFEKLTPIIKSSLEKSHESIINRCR